MKSPASDLASYLANHGLGLTLGENLFSAPMVRTDAPDVDALAVSVIDTGGPPPENYLGGRKALLTASVQIQIRSEIEDYNGGLTLAQAIWEKLHLAQLSGYTLVECEESAPNYIGPDKSGRHRFSFNIEMTYSWAGS